MRTLLNKIGTRWVLIALVVAVVAFVAGVNYGLRNSGGILAQASTPTPESTPTQDPQPTPDISKIVVPEGLPTATIEFSIINETVGPKTAARTEYNSVETGRAIYLYDIDKVIHLPDNVMVLDVLMRLYNCVLNTPCPSSPIYILLLEEATIAIDSSGIVWPGEMGTTGHGIDTFPFLKGYEVIR